MGLVIWVGNNVGDPNLFMPHTCSFKSIQPGASLSHHSCPLLWAPDLHAVLRNRLYTRRRTIRSQASPTLISYHTASSAVWSFHSSQDPDTAEKSGESSIWGFFFLFYFFAGVTDEVNYAAKTADRQQSSVVCVFVLCLISMILCVFVWQEGVKNRVLRLSDEGVLLPSVSSDPDVSLTLLLLLGFLFACLFCLNAECHWFHLQAKTSWLWDDINSRTLRTTAFLEHLHQRQDRIRTTSRTFPWDDVRFGTTFRTVS